MSDSRSKYDSGTQRGRDRALGDDSWRRESRSDPDSADGRYDRVSRYDDKQGSSERTLGDRGGTKEITSTIMIKGLTARTTEPSETGECKGFAFVEFPTPDYASYFMKAFAGSCGDPNAPQFIVDNRAVGIEYARENYPKGSREKDDDRYYDDRRGGSSGAPSSGIKCDWICASCSCQNFARRTECYRCAVPKSEKSLLINSNDPYSDAVICDPSVEVVQLPNSVLSTNVERFLIESAVISLTPTATLVVRGLTLNTSEEEVLEAFRQYAVVSNVRLARDRTTGISKGVAFVEFPSVEYANYTLQQANMNQLHVSNVLVKVGYAKDSAVAALAAQQSIPSAATNTYAAAALQAAQWSANNGYAMVPATLTPVTHVAPRASVSVPVAAPRQKPKWPPRFDTNGAAFLFQPQTGLFFEPLSEYYYCPKSKLYYNSLDGVYYKALPLLGSSTDFTDESCFLRYNPTPPTALHPEEGENSNVPSNTSATPVESGGAGRKPLVLSMCLGGKSKKDKAAKKDSTPVAVASLVAPTGGHYVTSAPAAIAGVGDVSAFKKSAISQNLAKWGEIKRQEVEDTIRPVDAVVYNVDARSSSANSVPVKDVRETQKQDVNNQDLPVKAGKDERDSGRIACLLCRRQFPSKDSLTRHEKESKMHAENLAKERGKSGGGSTSTIAYRDRASERRAAFGLSTEPISTARKRSRSRDRSEHEPRSHGLVSELSPDYLLSSSRPSGASSAEAPSVSADLSNPGNQLLRRFGWEEGKGLGKDGTGVKDPVGVTGAQKDSDKLGIGVKRSAIPPVEYGEGRVYKDSILRAARARFEQLESSEGSTEGPHL